jgi:phage replication-related protein YjqB (UPF0714/DUF867 family)
MSQLESGQRRIGGKIYWRVAGVAFKRDAEELAQRLRKQGYSARIIAHDHNRQGYGVYKR